MSSSGLLALIAILLPCWYVCKRGVLHGPVEINHVPVGDAASNLREAFS